VSGLWRACHKAVLPFNRPYRGGIPAAGVVTKSTRPGAVRSKLTVSLYSASWAETSLALHYSSVPSLTNPSPCRWNQPAYNSLPVYIVYVQTLQHTHRQTYHICAQHEWQQDNQGGATPDNHLQALAISSCRKVGCSSQRPRPRRRMAAL
jgi:hypothetical protein